MPDNTWEDSQPKEAAARLTLATVLLDAGSYAEALDQFTAVLTSDPANLEGLRGAAQSAEALGDAVRATGYRQLLWALEGSQASAAASQKMDAELDAGTPDAPLSVEEVPSSQPGHARLKIVHPDGSQDDDLAAERPSITLADVAGMDGVKRRLQVAFLGPLRNPELRKMYGKSLRGGLLLFGPPGCGKTFIARATAGELGAKFIAVGLSDVLDMWLGESERKLHEIFEAARRNAPAVLFFDEIDALGQKRSQLRYSAGRNVVNQLLAELDGVEHENDGIFVLGASNHPWDVDAALLRPGRFDRMTLVLPPDLAAREAILRLHLEDRPAEGVDVRWVAGRTKDFSGADLAYLCESAAEIAMEASLLGGVARPITTDDFRQVLKDIRPSTRPWFETARNYVLFANDGGTYDELASYMRSNKLL